MINDYGGYTLDITGPLMIGTQKLTSLAFSIHDGIYKTEDQLSEDQKKLAVKKRPNLLQFLSYLFYFHGILAGPLCFYSDYISFVDGSYFKVQKPQQINKKDEGDKTKSSNDVDNQDPSPTKAVLSKFTLSAICITVMFTLAPLCAKVTNADEKFIRTHTFLYRIAFLLLSVGLARGKYYFAWKFGESINNASGLGFNGYDESGRAKWDLVKNVSIRKLESATSLKGIVDNWNIQTTVWLRRVCYERVPFQKTFITYVLSATWHGFYPGYYFSFIGAVFFTQAARAVRRNIRPHFQSSNALRVLYDIITWFFAQLSLGYLIVPFTILEFWPTVYFYHYSMYWFLHIIVILTIVALPSKGGRSRSTEKAKDS